MNLEEQKKKRKQKALSGWSLLQRPFEKFDAGDAELNAAMFNASADMSASGGPLSGSNQGMGEGLNEKFEQHDALNPKLWNEDKELDPEIESKLYEVIDQYIEDSAFLKEEDILRAELCGSNCSYNYTDKSDLDLHLIVDLDKLTKDPAFGEYANNGEKSLFNKRYEIDFKGINVEVYVQDVNSNTASNGIYNLYEREWIKEPEMIEADINYNEYDKKYQSVKEKAQALLASNDIKGIQTFINNLYLNRRNSLETEGEAGTDNNIFKDLRNEGILEALKERIAELTSKKLSIN